MLNENEINNLDSEDIGLKEIFGERFHDETTGTQQTQKARANTKSTITAQAESVAQKPINKAMDAQWEPVRPEPNWMDNLKACAKSVLLFGGLSFLIFYWKEAGLMASSIAVPSMCICTALAGWGAGRNIRGNR